MRKTFFFLFVFVLGTVSFRAIGQQRHKIAIFAPLYLDSAFNYAGGYRFNKTFPKFLNAGVEYIQGVQLALDSLDKRGAPLEVFIYDTKSATMPIAQQMRSAEMRDVELIIANSNPAETRQLADIAQAKKVPFVSSTLPNDAGVSNNPYFVVLNTTLQGHIEGLYRMLQKAHSLDKIILFRKSGPQEDAIRSHFMDFGKTTSSAPLSIKVVDVGEFMTPAKLSAHMDSTKRNVVIVGSMEEAFGMELSKNLSQLAKTYPTIVIGMPTWENFNFNKPELRSLDIIYSTPFYYSRLTPLESKLTSNFEKEIGSRPTDHFLRGYETTMRFGLLLLETKKDIASSLTNKGSTVFTRFDIQPVFKDKNAMRLDFFENKNLYFIRVNGAAKRMM